MKENAKRTAGPATQPICAIAHASDRTPEPITAVIICALAVNHVPSNSSNQVSYTIIYYHSKKIKIKKITSI
jgi:hypothetical protein